MSQGKGVTRRTVIKGALAGAATGIAGFPFISYGQSDVIRIGHLTPRTGFLGPLGEYAVMAVDLAVEEINAAGGVLGRKIEALKEDSVNPQTASTKAERMIERDKVIAIVGEISSASKPNHHELQKTYLAPSRSFDKLTSRLQMRTR